MAAPVLPSDATAPTSNGVSQNESITAATTSDSPTIYRILVLGGDHVGPEVMKEAVKVLEVVNEKRSSKFKLELRHELAGGCSMDTRGVPITDEVMRIAHEESDAVLFGSVGGPKW